MNNVNNVINNAIAKDAMGFYETVKSYAMSGDQAKAVSLVMTAYGDQPMANIMNQLSAQLDFYEDNDTDGALARTYATIDRMMKERNAHHADKYIDKLTDDMVLAMSSGEVTADSYSLIRSQYIKHGLFDPAIFGGSGKMKVYHSEDELTSEGFGTKMGHIALPCHVVLHSHYDIIADLLDISTDDVHRIVNFTCYVNKADHSLLTAKEYKEQGGTLIEFMTGGDAIYEMLTALHYEDKPERLAFQVVPVVSPITRPIAYYVSAEGDTYASSEGDTYASSAKLNTWYEHVINRVARINKLAGLNAPDIIMMNEKRMLNDCVNGLLSELEVDLLSLNSRFAKKKASLLAQHNYCQLKAACRDHLLHVYQLPEVPATEIESLNLFPEFIMEKCADGTEREISLEKVITANGDALFDFDEEHAMILPCDADLDHLSVELQAKSDAIDEERKKLVAVTNEIWTTMKEKREACEVIFDGSINMYRAVQ